MKKRLAIVLVCVLVVLSAGCGAPAAPSSTKSGGNVPTVPTQAPNVSISEQVLYDKDGVLVKATKLNPDAMFGPELTLYIENNGSKNITVQARDESINGYMVTSVFSTDIAAGKKVNDTLSFLASDLEKCGIATIADITFSIHIFNAETYKTIVDTDPVTISTTAASSYTQQRNTEGTVLLEKSDIKIVYQGAQKGTLGDSFVLYIENNSKTPVTIQARSVSVNGYMVDPIFSCDIMPGKAAVSSLDFMTSDFEKNNIVTATKIELSFTAFNTKTFKSIFKSASLTIQP